ncbi:HPr family phosphocarrier protein [Paludifilum halophilum]|uniref:HPr family phosphocarrier protein n=1 Tax=Paludifilum halophilum TaxID=1642702 RepID=UPI00146E8D46|nr:HPr family phosphocarrier protein [Paludifilum halophilum]
MRKKRNFTIRAKPSLREVTQFVETARRYSSHIMVCHGKITANSKGLLGLVSLFVGVESGDQLVLTAAGPDAEQALKQLSDFFHNIPIYEGTSLEASVQNEQTSR